MDKTELSALVKSNLGAIGVGKDLIISDAIQEALNYCNLTELPEALEPYIRRKSQSVINYETENGTTAVFDIKSIKEGDNSTTYNVDDTVSKETIYGLSDKDKKNPT